MHDKLTNENENVIEEMFLNISLISTIFTRWFFFLNKKKDFRMNSFESFKRNKSTTLYIKSLNAFK